MEPYNHKDSPIWLPIALIRSLALSINCWGCGPSSPWLGAVLSTTPKRFSARGALMASHILKCHIERKLPMKISNVPRWSPTINRGTTCSINRPHDKSVGYTTGGQVTKPTALTATTGIAKTRHHNALFPVLFVLPGLLTTVYAALSLYAATRLAHAPQGGCMKCL